MPPRRRNPYWQWRIIAFLGAIGGIVLAACRSFIINTNTTSEGQSSTLLPLFRRSFNDLTSAARSYSFFSQTQYGFLIGWMSATVLLPIGKWCAKRLLFRWLFSNGDGSNDDNDDDDDDRLYGLDHAILQVELPPRSTLWMNMGYWEVCTRHFQPV